MPTEHITTDHAAREKQADSEQASFVASHEWTLVGLLAVAAFALGCIGFAQTLTFEAQGGPSTWWDVVYSSFRMFIFEAPDESAGWPL